jgi:hypothetical protein
MSGRVDVHMQNGLIVARLQVGTCVYVTQGPPIEVQLLDPDNGYVWCPSEEVQKNARFAANQSKRTTPDDGQPRRDPSELHAMRSQGHGW